MKASLVIALLLVLAGCSGGSGGNSELPSQAIDDAPAMGHLRFAKMPAAKIRVYQADNLNDALCETESHNLEIELPKDCIQRGLIYVVKANDASGSELYAIARGDELMNAGGWSISAMTDALFQSLHNYLVINNKPQDILAAANRVAPLLFSGDLNGDGINDYRDLLLWQSGDASNIDRLLETTDYTSPRMQNVVNPPLDDVLIGRLNTREPAHKVIIRGNTAFVTTQLSLLIVDISDKTVPRLKSAYPTGWIKDIEVIDHTAYLAIDGAGLERVDVNDLDKPVHSAYLDRVAHKLASEGQHLWILGKQDDEIVVSRLQNNTEAIQSLRLYRPVDKPLLIKKVDQRLMVATTSFADSTLLVIDPETLSLVDDLSMARDYAQPAGLHIVDIFEGNDEIHIATKKLVSGMQLISTSADDLSLRGDTFINVYSLVEKNTMKVIRLNGVMYLHEGMDFVNRVGRITMPADVKLVYFEPAFNTLALDPVKAVKKLGEAHDYLKRFQFSEDNQYSFFASDRHGFSILKH